MICYHTTDAADGILRDGFRDSTGSYMLAPTGQADRRMAQRFDTRHQRRREGDQVLQVEFPDDVDLGEYELVVVDPKNRCSAGGSVAVSGELL